jgi:hypothetical protein
MANPILRSFPEHRPRSCDATQALEQSKHGTQTRHSVLALFDMTGNLGMGLDPIHGLVANYIDAVENPLEGANDQVCLMYHRTDVFPQHCWSKDLPTQVDI